MSIKNITIIVFSLFILCFLPAFCGGSYNVYSPNEYSPIIRDDNDYEKILFILDLSNSMNDDLGGYKKIDIAINSLARITSRLNPKIKVGLRVYGHKFGFNPILGCSATELVSPIRENNAGNINSILSGLRATGWTPITRSLKNAVNSDFLGITGQKRIILLTDGGENCDESPCDYAIKLVQSRDDIKIDVIEFAINDELADEQLRCTALATTGKLYKANDAESLAQSLENALNVEKDVQGTIIKK